MANKINVDKELFVEVCSNSISMAQAAAKLGLHFNTFQKYAKQLGVYKTNMGLKGGKRNKPSYIDLNEVLEGKHPEYSRKRIKARLFANGLKEKQCECCGNDTWNGEPIPLELDHIDGDRTNNRLENLKIICPNCHAQTETYRGKNKRVSDLSVERRSDLG